MTPKQLLIEQFLSCYNGTDWFVSLMTSIEGLTAEQASRHDGSSNNSIWKIVIHYCPK